MSPPPDGVNSQSRWSCRTASRTYGRYYWSIKRIDPQENLLARSGTWISRLALTSWNYKQHPLTHWGRVTHICIGNLTIIGSVIGLSPGRRQAIIWTYAGILSIGHLGTNFNEILIEIQILSSKKIRLKMSSAKWRLFSLGLNELRGTFPGALG